MEQLFAKKLMSELKIDVTRLVQEEWEMKILKILFDSSLGEKLIFEGGTALRLAYNSPRFSEDLDFSLKGTMDERIFLKTLKTVEEKYYQVSISETRHKFYTHFCLLKVKESWLPKAFSIKIEISKRKRKEEIEIRTLMSPTAAIQVIAKIQTLEQILSDKMDAIKKRAKPRDFFDVWYIHQLKHLPLKPFQVTISKEILKSELRKYLPKNYWPVVDQIVKKVKR